jgi:NAD-dependent deacetylase
MSDEILVSAIDAAARALAAAKSVVVFTGAGVSAESGIPNAAHHAIAEIERRVSSFVVVTQNVDGLHHRAGSANVIELHGTLRRARCVACSRYSEWPDPPGEPTCGDCGGLLRPDVVMFEEMLPEGAIEAAIEAARACDVLFSVGTSALVWPAAEIPLAAANAGKTVVVVNPDLEGQPWGRTTISIKGAAGAVLPRVVERAWDGEQR